MEISNSITQSRKDEALLKEYFQILGRYTKHNSHFFHTLPLLLLEAMLQGSNLRIIKFNYNIEKDNYVRCMYGSHVQHRKGQNCPLETGQNALNIA